MRPAVLVAGAAVWGGCADAPADERGPFSVKDSAGIEVVDVWEPLAAGDDGWRLTGEPLARIGAVAGPPEFQFSSPEAFRRETGCALPAIAFFARIGRGSGVIRSVCSVDPPQRPTGRPTECSGPWKTPSPARTSSRLASASLCVSVRPCLGSSWTPGAEKHSAPRSWSSSREPATAFSPTFSSYPTRGGRSSPRKQVTGAPDLVVEVLSPSTAHRDRRIKLDLYARHGVRQYWIVDPDEDSVDVWRFGDESGHERFSGELPVRLGRERLGPIDLEEVFSRHLDVWSNG